MKKTVKNVLIAALGIIFGVTIFVFYESALRKGDIFGGYRAKAPASNILKLSSPPVQPSQPTKTEMKILFVGDTMLARSIGEREKLGVDPFEMMRSVFDDYEAVIANLETTISDKGAKLSGKAFTFRAPVESTLFLKNAKIMAVSLANNHTKDYGDNALLDTIERLNNAGILNFGAGADSEAAFLGKILEVEGVKIGLMGFNEIENRYTVNQAGPTSAWNDLGRIKAEITRLKSASDLVIVMPHWGKEYSLNQNSWQEKLGHELIDAGADAVIGSHPHVIQPNETYHNKPIYYSMGNFVFDQMQDLKGATDGEMIELIIVDKKIYEIKAIRIKIGLDGRPGLVAD